MSRTKIEMDDLKEKSEKTFRKILDEYGYVYLYIDQEKDTFSSKIWKSMAKRPDFLVSLPNIGSIFVDVKAKEENVFYEWAHEKLEKNPLRCFHFSVQEIIQHNALQNETSINVWYAVLPVKGISILDNLVFIPNKRIFNFFTDKLLSRKKYNYCQVPAFCFNGIDTLSDNICADCKEKYCEDVEKLYELETGKSLSEDDMEKYCSECEMTVPDDARFCSYCGERFKEN